MKKRQTGFTLLEAMVSIVILSMSSFAIYSWVSISVEMLIRSDEVLAQEQLVTEAIERLKHTDMDVQKRGEFSSGELILSWRAEELEKKESRNNADFIGYHDLTLYNIRIAVTKNENLVAQYETRHLVSRRVRDPEYE